MEGEVPKKEENENQLEDSGLTLEPDAEKSEPSGLELDEDLSGSVERDFDKPEFKYGEHKEDVEHTYEVRTEKLDAAKKELEEYTGYGISQIRDLLARGENKSFGGSDSAARIKSILNQLDAKEAEIKGQRKFRRETGLQNLAEQI